MRATCELHGKRWVNLWTPARPVKPEICDYQLGPGDLDAGVVVRNLGIILGVLVGTLILHIFVISGVEAFWLTKVRMILLSNLAGTE